MGVEAQLYLPGTSQSYQEPPDRHAKACLEQLPGGTLETNEHLTWVVVFPTS